MIQSLKTKYLRWKAIRTLRNQYEYVTEVNKLMEEYFTERLLDGGTSQFMKQGRESLLQSQAEIKKNTEFLQFLNKTK